MKNNYILYIILLIVILARSTFLNLTTNLLNILFINSNDLEVNIIKNQNEYLLYSFDSLIDFKSHINMEHNYTITNVIKNNYGFNNMIISGSEYEIGDEVVTLDGLVGIVTNILKDTSVITPLHNTNIVVNIGNERGKITGKDEDNNLIIKEVSNYNNIKLNDLVYSTNNTFIGRIIRIKYEPIDNYLTVKTHKLNNIKYVAVISR